MKMTSYRNLPQKGGYHVRCSHCSARRVLKRHPENYTIIPACHYCGGRKYRAGYPGMRRPKQITCESCAGYHFPHRLGSGQCEFREYKEDLRPALTDEDYSIDPDEEF